MADAMKSSVPTAADIKALVSAARRAKLFAYGFVLAFVACTAFLAFNPSANAAAPRFSNPFSPAAVSSLHASFAPYRSRVSSLFSHLFPNSSSSPSSPAVSDSKGAALGAVLPPPTAALRENRTRPQVTGSPKNGALGEKDGSRTAKNQTVSSSGSKPANKEEGEAKKGASLESKSNKNGVLKNQTASSSGSKQGKKEAEVKKGSSSSKSNGAKSNSTQTAKGAPASVNLTSSIAAVAAAKAVSDGNGRKREKWIEDMIGCDVFHGHWVKDEANYPLYPEGSCPHIDEPFDCYRNGRPDRSYQKLRWQPTGCNIPRLNATDMLERLRGKRLVFVGDSLNRNMWESLVCALRHSVKDKSKVFEASGRHEFRTEGSYSFLFKDYGATVEFFRSPFLVQEWEMPAGNGTKETLRLDLIERSSSKYKDAHAIIFNTGHWWTHEKTSKGKDYYQEGNRVYSELNVVDAFHKALNTWSKWVDANVNPKKSLVFFRGYSASHFSGGQWNSGGACDKETVPIENEKYLSTYPPKMSILESVIKQMKTPVSYLNITRMTDYRKDAHPSVYRKQNLTEEERRDPLRFQDCSHWCLPGVPDTWNELLYAQIIVKQYQMGR